MSFLLKYLLRRISCNEHLVQQQKVNAELCTHRKIEYGDTEHRFRIPLDCPTEEEKQKGLEEFRGETMKKYNRRSDTSWTEFINGSKY